MKTAGSFPAVFVCRSRVVLRRHPPRRRGIQYAAAYRFNHCCLWNTGSSAFADDPAEYEAAFSRRIAPEACIFFWPSSKLRAPQLPTPKGIYAARAVTRGPRIDLAGPDASDVRSPLRLQLKFRGFGGATINLDLLRVTYVKMPNVDLTSRVRPYAQPTGIEIPDAEAPPGEHLVRVEIHDSEGRRTVTTFLLSVAR